MKRTIARRSFIGAAAGALLSPSIVVGRGRYNSGATDSEIKLGHTCAYSGPLSAYGVTGKAIAAYWGMVNDAGGINGRKINFISYDDGFTPPKTVEMVRKLVESDYIFSTFQLFGTPTNAVVRKYLNQKKMPQLFIFSGASQWGDPKEFPWTMGWQPDYATEAGIYAKHIIAHNNAAKIAILWENDDSGKDYIAGFMKALGPDRAKQVVGSVSYEATDPTVNSQLIQLKNSGADTLFLAAASKAVAQAIRKAADLGWKPACYVCNVSASVTAVMKPAGFNNAQGVMTASYLKDPTDTQWAASPDLMRWKSWMAKYHTSGSTQDILNVFAFAVSATMHEVLQRCGDELTRENLMKQATSLKQLEIPLLLPGVKINTSPTDYYPIQSVRLQRFKGETWELFGDVVSNESS